MAQVKKVNKPKIVEKGGQPAGITKDATEVQSGIFYEDLSVKASPEVTEEDAE